MEKHYEIFPPESIRVYGEIGDRMKAAAEKILHHLDIEELFAKHFRNRLVEPEAYRGFVGYGMLLDAIVKAAAAMPGSEMRLLKEKRIAELIATQAGDGSISIFGGEKGRWDNHEQAYIIQALVQDYQLFGNNEALEAATKLGKYLVANKTSANIGVDQALLMLFAATGDQRFLEYCRTGLKIRSGMEEYGALMPENGVEHVYSYLARSLAQLKYAELTGEEYPELLAGAEEAFRRIFHEGYSSVSGSCTGGRGWGETWNRSQIGLGGWGETCATAYLLRHTVGMQSWKGDSVYGDLFERVMYNAFFAAQSPDGLQQRYFVPFNEVPLWFKHETYCCPNNFRRMVFELPRAVYFKAPDGIAVNLYASSELDTEEAKLVQQTDYPEGEEVTLRVEPKIAKEFTLYLRIPRRCDNAQVTFNGEILPGKPGTWLEIRRVWRESVELKIHLPMRIRIVAGTNAQIGRGAVLRGPVVYGLGQGKMPYPDLFELRPELPMEFADGQIRLRGNLHYKGIHEREAVFCRFSSPEREQTFFRIASGAENDEIYL